jgi:hypothetical protein
MRLVAHREESTFFETCCCLRVYQSLAGFVSADRMKYVSRSENASSRFAELGSEGHG